VGGSRLDAGAALDDLEHSFQPALLRVPLRGAVMSEKYAGLRVGILGLAVFVLAVVAVIHFGAQLEKINWQLVSFICVAAVVLFVLYRWNDLPKNKSTYDVQDLFMTDGHADLWKHLIMFFAGLSAWTIIQKVITDPKGDITALLTIVLGVFVSKEILGAFADAMKSRPVATPAASQDIHITAAPEASKPAAAALAPLADIADAGSGVEPLSPVIQPKDVGSSVAIVKRKGKK
jgi:hypothetical protein